jgi:hypothetical protein
MWHDHAPSRHLLESPSSSKKIVMRVHSVSRGIIVVSGYSRTVGGHIRRPSLPRAVVYAVPLHADVSIVDDPRSWDRSLTTIQTSIIGLAGRPTLVSWPHPTRSPYVQFSNFGVQSCHPTTRHRVQPGKRHTIATAVSPLTPPRFFRSSDLLSARCTGATRRCRTKEGPSCTDIACSARRGCRRHTT